MEQNAKQTISERKTISNKLSSLLAYFLLCSFSTFPLSNMPPVIQLISVGDNHRHIQTDNIQQHTRGS